jgi:putative oxidoreductase
MKRTIIVEIICTLLILLFVYTASSKLIDLKKTYFEMNNQPFPNWMTPYLVWGISLLELIIAGLLCFNRTKKAGLWGSLIIMTLFTGYIGSILLHFFARVPCSCGGVIKQLGWTNHLYFNLFFVAISIIGITLMRKQRNENEYLKSSQTAFT